MYIFANGEGRSEGRTREKARARTDVDKRKRERAKEERGIGKNKAWQAQGMLGTGSFARMAGRRTRQGKCEQADRERARAG